MQVCCGPLGSQRHLVGYCERQEAGREVIREGWSSHVPSHVQKASLPTQPPLQACPNILGGYVLDSAMDT